MVARVHTDLVVAREGIHEAEEFMTGRGVYYEINPRWGGGGGGGGGGELSFGQALLMFVKSMQNRHLLFAFLMRTSRVLYFSDCLCLEELTDLFINHLLSF